MKKKTLLLFAAAMALGMQTGVYAADDNSVSVVVNGESVTFDQSPVIENGRTLVPFRGVLEKMGATVEWDGVSQKVTCTLDDKKVSLVIGSDKMTTADGELTLDAPAKIINARTMVPIRAISEGLGAQVDWDGNSRVVTVTSAADEQHEGYSIKTLNNDIILDGKVIMPITVKYPVFDNAPAANAKILEQASALAESYHNEYKADVESYVKEFKPDTVSWYVKVNYDVKYDSPEFVSMYRKDNIYTGGAHDNIVVGGLTLDRDNGTAVDADQIVPDSYQNALAGIKSLAEDYAKTYGNTFKDYNEPSKESFYYDGAIVYVMPPYEIAPFSEGVIQYRITQPENNSTESYSYKNIANDIKNTDGTATILKINAKYPVINGTGSEIQAVNSAIEADAQARVKDCESQYAADAKDFFKTNVKTAANWSCDINYEVKYLDDSIISIFVTESVYLGGAHPNTLASGLTYNLQTGVLMKAEDFAENAISRAEKGIGEMAKADPEQYPFYDEATFKLSDDSFYIKDSQLVFVVQQYEIAPYARGIVEYTIDLEGI